MRNTKDEVMWTRRAAADLRIVKKDDFAEICKQKRYLNFPRAESSNFRRYTHKILNKLVGKARLEKGAEVQWADNKGYPKGFKNFDTYDAKHDKSNRTNRCYSCDV